MVNNSPAPAQMVFRSAVGKQKPQTMRDHEAPCPFCDRSQLPAILKEDGDILLVPNKYPILKGSTPFVLIETADCESELSLYPKDRLLRIFRMGFGFWRELMADPQYRSVVFFKNHGPMSGGSLRHPHMQLMGLADVDYRQNMRRQDFHGPVIYEAPGVELNLSDHPRIGFVEFNAVLTDEQAFDSFCVLIQKTVVYLLQRHNNGRVNSYNLFFYDLDGIVYCKAMPRHATTPLYMGYSIPQVVDNLDFIAADFREYCLPIL